MSLSGVDYALAGGAALVAGAVNALAGGGTLISFPTLVGLGVPSVAANVTNTVALCPGYFAGSYAQRDDLRAQRRRLPRLAVAAAAGGLAGSILLVVTPEKTFRAAVPYLIVISCVLLISQDRVRTWLNARSVAVAAASPSVADGDGAFPVAPASWVLCVVVGLAAVYGGFFGAGLGIMVLAVLGIFIDDTVVRLNGVKQAISFVVNVVAAMFFAFSGDVRWELVPVMAVAALVGGHLGGRCARVVDPTWLRRIVVLAGLAIAVNFWVG